MKKIIRVFLILSFIFLTSFLFIGNYFYNVSLNARISKEKVVKQDKDGKKDEKFEENVKWLEKKYSEVKIESVTKKDIYGYKILNENSKDWIIAVHGYTNYGLKMATFIRNFNKMGYNVLVPDLLAHGKSENDFYTMGHQDSKDLARWVEFLSKEYPDSKIYLFGVSMGASTVLNSLDENLSSNVAAFISDSAYINLTEQFSYQLKKLYNLPSFPILNFASLITKIRAGFFLSEVNAENALKNTNIPALILHGEDDSFVPVSNAYKIYELLNSEKEIKIFKGAKHVKAYFLDKEEYFNIIKEFLEKR